MGVRSRYVANPDLCLSRAVPPNCASTDSSRAAAQKVRNVRSAAVSAIERSCRVRRRSTRPLPLAGTLSGDSCLPEQDRTGEATVSAWAVPVDTPSGLGGPRLSRLRAACRRARRCTLRTGRSRCPQHDPSRPLGGSPPVAKRQQHDQPMVQGERPNHLTSTVPRAGPRPVSWLWSYQEVRQARGGRDDPA